MGEITVFISYQYPWESPAAARRLIEKHGYLHGWKNSKTRKTSSSGNSRTDLP